MEESKNLEQNLDKSNEKLHISDVMNSILSELEELKTKYSGESKIAVTEFNDNVSHFKLVGKVRGLNEAIKIVKKYCS
jgi:hypothetical protein